MEQLERFPEQLVLEQLVSLRKKAGLTQKTVEQRLDWRQGTLYDFEKSRLKISLEAAWALLRLYDADWKDLFEAVPEQATGMDPWVAPLVQIGMVAQPLQALVEGMRQDPIIAAEIGLEQLQTATPVLQLMLMNLTLTQRRDFFLELCRYVNSMMTADHRIRPEEKRARDILLDYAPMDFDERERASLLRAFECRYLGKGLEKKFPKEAQKHLLLWILYIVALSDAELNHYEEAYIEAVAENVELKKSSLHYIRTQVLRFHQETLS